MSKRWKPDDDQFDAAVEDAIEGLPVEFAELLENLAIMVEDEPTRDDLEEVSEGDTELLGIYRGVPRTERFVDDIARLPDEIVIFRRPILRVTTTREAAIAEIRDTVVHEIGHYFGLDDDEMEY